MSVRSSVRLPSSERLRKSTDSLPTNPEVLSPAVETWTRNSLAPDPLRYSTALNPNCPSPVDTSVALTMTSEAYIRSSTGGGASPVILRCTDTGGAPGGPPYIRRWSGTRVGVLLLGCDRRCDGRRRCGRGFRRRSRLSVAGWGRSRCRRCCRVGCEYWRSCGIIPANGAACQQ